MTSITTFISEDQIAHNTKTQITQALAKAKAEGKILQSGFMNVGVNLSYSSLLLPYKKGMELMAALEGAETYEQSYGGPPKLQLLGSEFTFSAFPQTEYELVRAAVLLNISLDDLKKNLR